MTVSILFTGAVFSAMSYINTQYISSHYLIRNVIVYLYTIMHYLYCNLIILDNSAQQTPR